YSVTIKPSTRSARSIAVTSVLKLWRYGGRREPPIRLRPTARASHGDLPTKSCRISHKDGVSRCSEAPHSWGAAWASQNNLSRASHASHPPPLDVIGSRLGITFQAAQTWKRK